MTTVTLENQTTVTASRVVIEPSHGWMSLDLRAVWEYRELLLFFVWRDILLRYKQTALGVAWIILQPVISMGVFGVLFGVLLSVPSGGVPYPLFALAGLLPWSYFAASLTRSSSSIVDSAHLIGKVYFPRLTVPLAGVLSSLVDLGIAALVLIGLMACYGVTPSPTVLLLPAFLVLAMSTALGAGLWLSALNVRYRDVQQLVPFLVRTWMYLTPVVYASTLIPERYRFLLSLNPMTGVVEGFRWALLGRHLADARPSGGLFAASIIVALGVLISGLVYFRHTEDTFADVL